ncbi:hypothetical protein V6N11_017272 [Hibiscus sabdariffa]|uniref:Uncharacterized protein n=1 Tax=Hibiscus sabdariffa TaxID=183260 RepID=A0ABR2TXI3_9ROSI
MPKPSPICALGDRSVSKSSHGLLSPRISNSLLGFGVRFLRSLEFGTTLGRWGVAVAAKACESAADSGFYVPEFASKSKSKRGGLAAGKRLYKSSIQRAKQSVRMKMRANRMADMMEEKRMMEGSLRASRRDVAETEERLRLVETTRNRLLLEFNGITILFMLLRALEALLTLALPFY